LVHSPTRRARQDQAVHQGRLADGAPERKGLSERWIAQAVEESLRRLKVDTIDIYFSHRPDPNVDHAETLGAYDKLIQAGKIRAIGASNFDADILSAALATAERDNLPAYQVIQPEYNLYDRETFDGKLRDLSIERNLGVVTYFSLASGFLSGKYRSKADLEGRQRAGLVEKYLTDRGTALLDVLDEVSAAHSAAPVEVALAWLIAREGVTAPIASATSALQVESFARAVSLKLKPDEIVNLANVGQDAT
jgi:aryl-alcohol dehydrogenase-like predicted oxidoreductase